MTKRWTESQLLEMLGLESIQSLIRKRKLQWVAHCARRGEEDLTWKRMVREVEDGKSKWGTRLKEDWRELGVKSIGGWCNQVKDRGRLASHIPIGREQEEGEREEDTGFESIEDFNVTSNAEEKFAGATLSSAEVFKFDMTL